MVDDSHSPVSLVTGSNSGIGRATAVRLAREGHRVAASMRDPSKAAKLLAMADDAGVSVEVVALDITDTASVQAAVTEVTERLGPIELLVCNAGVGGNATVEECAPERFAEVMDANLLGAVRCIQAVLPSMRARKQGAIVGITSVVGRVAALAQAPYVASKWAMEGMLEELAQEVAGFGVRVAIVEPGITKSAIFAKNVDVPNSTGAYDAHYRRLLAFYATGMAQSTPAEEVADVVLAAATAAEPVLRWRVSWSANELIEGRVRIGDEGWVALGRHLDDDDYYAAFESAFGIDLTPGAEIAAGMT